MVKYSCNDNVEELIEIKAFRRGIIVLCILNLLLTGITSWPEGKYYDPALEVLVKEGKAQVIEVDKSFQIDNDTMHIKRIINTEDKTYIRWVLMTREKAWTFPDSAIKIIDDKNKEYPCFGGMSGKAWGEEGLLQTERISKDAKYIIIKFEWFDRSNQIEVSLNQEDQSIEK